MSEREADIITDVIRVHRSCRAHCEKQTAKCITNRCRKVIDDQQKGHENIQHSGERREDFKRKSTDINEQSFERMKTVTVVLQSLRSFNLLFRIENN